MAITLPDHPALGKTYEILIGGVAFQGQCREVWTSSKPVGKTFAECQYFNTGNPDDVFNVPVDAAGKQING